MAGALLVAAPLVLSGCSPLTLPDQLRVYASPGKDLSDDMKAGTKFSTIAQAYLSPLATNNPSARAYTVSVKPTGGGGVDFGIDDRTYSFTAADYASFSKNFTGTPAGTTKAYDKTFPNGNEVTLASYLRDTKGVFDGTAGTDYKYLDAERFTESTSGDYEDGSFVIGQETPAARYPSTTATYNGTFRVNIIDKTGTSPNEYVLTGDTYATVNFGNKSTYVVLAAKNLDTNYTGAISVATVGNPNPALEGSGTLNDQLGTVLNPNADFTANTNTGAFTGAQATMTSRVFGPNAEEFGGAISFSADHQVGHGYAVGK